MGPTVGPLRLRNAPRPPPLRNRRVRALRGSELEGTESPVQGVRADGTCEVELGRSRQRA